MSGRDPFDHAFRQKSSVPPNTFHIPVAIHFLAHRAKTERHKGLPSRDRPSKLPLPDTPKRSSAQVRPAEVLPACPRA